ncbi:MAG: acyl-CoA thioesterase [Deltaproteobacteria bacterium]|nr:acyl-CoA thioesterase [Deltaproteobacteria bacterium]
MAFQTSITTRFGDVDFAGGLYYPTLFHYFHMAFEEYLRSEIGVDYRMLFQDYRIGFPLVHLDVTFHRPVHYGGTVVVELSVEKLGRTSVNWRYRMFVEGEEGKLAVDCSMVTVCMKTGTGEKLEIPPWLKEKFESLLRVSK